MGRAARAASSAVLTVLLLAHASSAGAAGMYIPGIGGPGVGRAGASITDPAGLGVLWYNPAALASIDGIYVFGELSMVEAAIKFDRLDDPTIYDTNGGVFEEVRNEAGLFFIPMLGAALRLQENIGLAFGFYAPHAGVWDFPLVDHDDNPDTPDLGPARYSVIESANGQTFVEVALGVRIAPRLDVGLTAGVSTIFVDELFAIHASLTAEEDPGSDGILAVKAMDRASPSLGLGVRWRPVERLTLAMSARAPIKVHAKGTFDLILGPNLTALGVEVTGQDVTVDFHMPLILRGAVGYACPSGLWNAELAVVWENWGHIGPIIIDARDVTISSLIGKETIGILPIDRGFRDAVSTRLGGQVRVVPRHLWVQLGAAFESAGTRRELLSPSTNDPHKLVLGAGVTGRWGRFMLTFSYQHIWLSPTTVTDSESEQLNALNDEAVTVIGNGDYRGFYAVGSVSLAVRLSGPWSLASD